METAADVFEVFLEGDRFPTGFFHAAVAAENFQGRTEAGKDRISTDNAFFCKARHPIVDTLGKFGENFAPVTDILLKRTIRVLTRATDKVNG